jgi:hypothetical protein
VFNTTFKNINLKRGGQFYWWRKPEYTEESTDLSQVTDKVNLIIMHKVKKKGGRRDCDRMIVGFTTTYAISAHHR